MPQLTFAGQPAEQSPTLRTSSSACSCMKLAEKLTSHLELNVTDPVYASAVAKAFGNTCCYCGRPLEIDRASVEHLDGMNRFRVGLHIPGNVIIACARCNREKRRDDAIVNLTLAQSGWESFLSHDSTKCETGCNSCSYWNLIWPDSLERAVKLGEALARIRAFRENYAAYLELNSRAKIALAAKMDAIYRDCQSFATERIREAVEDVLRAFPVP